MGNGIVRARAVSEQETLADNEMSVDVHETARMGGKHQQQRRVVGNQAIHDVVMAHEVNSDQLVFGFGPDDAFCLAGLLRVPVVVLSVARVCVLHFWLSR